MMHGRILCHRCRQRLSATPNATTIQCPSCKSDNKIPSHRSSSQDHGRAFLLVDVFAKATKKLRHHSGNTKSACPSVASNAGKRALLIGVTYSNNRKYKLEGSIHDVKNMRNLLINKFCFHPDNICILTETKLHVEEKQETNLVPTKKNIQKSMKWLVEGCAAGDSLVFYYSGHGLRQFDIEGDEKDGFDETICPVDFMENGMIDDNEIFTTMVAPLPHGVTLHAIVDACHSGTIIDLAFEYNRRKNEWEKSHKPKHTRGGIAISISACEDSQKAADTSAFTENKMSGAMTSILVDILKKNKAITYGKLLDLIYDTIDKENQEGCFMKMILREAFNRKILQNAQLSASEQFNVYERQFAL